MNSADVPPIGRLLMLGIRGATPRDPALRADLDACRAVGCRAVVLFDVDLHALTYWQSDHRLARPEALARATRNIISPDQLRELTAHIRDALGAGALIAVDQEGGRVARLKAERGFAPSVSAAAFARLPADGRAEAARAMASELAACSINLNFAPCVDLALNPENPVIALLDRAYAADPEAVTACAAAFIRAHREHGVLTCLKHFPGHGCSATDSHHGEADVSGLSRPGLELAPYRDLIADGLADFIMTAHVTDRAVDPDHPATFSRSFLDELLRRRLGFRGVVVTDALDMGAVTHRLSPEQASVLALQAGADLLLHANNAPGPDPGPLAPRLETIIRAIRDGVDPQRLREAAERFDRLPIGPA